MTPLLLSFVVTYIVLHNSVLQITAYHMKLTQVKFRLTPVFKSLEQQIMEIHISSLGVDHEK